MSNLRPYRWYLLIVPVLPLMLDSYLRILMGGNGILPDAPDGSFLVFLRGMLSWLGTVSALVLTVARFTGVLK